MAFFEKLAQRIKKIRMDRAWREVKRTYLDDAKSMLEGNDNFLMFNGHKYETIDGRIIVDNKPGTKEDLQKLLEEIEEIII